MIKIYFLVAIFIQSTIASDALDNEILLYAKEFTINEYKKEQKKFNIYKSKFQALDSIKIDSQSKDHSYYLNELRKLEKEANSLLVSSIVLNRYIMFISLKNYDLVKQYIVPVADKLYENKLCDGYIFTGEYEFSINKNLKKSLEVYKEGIKNCKIEWKRFELLGRLNKYSYLREKGISIDDE